MRSLFTKLGSSRARRVSAVPTACAFGVAVALAACSAPPSSGGSSPATVADVSGSPGADAGAGGANAGSMMGTGDAAPSSGDAGMAAAKAAACASAKFALSPAHGYDTGTDHQTYKRVAVGDLNGDGKADFVTTGGINGEGPAGGLIAAYLNKGDGTFGAMVPSKGYYAGLSALGDVTGDGVLDLVAPDRVFPGNGDGTFGLELDLKGTSSFVGSSGVRVMITDLNGDKIPDVVLTNGKIGVMMNAGKGELGAPVLYGTNQDDRVALGDFNSDGKPDLVAVSEGEGARNVEVLLNAGAGTFPMATTYTSITASTGNTTAVAAGDFNGDGKDDFAVLASPDGYISIVDIFINKGDGTFDSNKVKSYAVSKLVPADLIAADVNGDGKMDLVAGASAVGQGRVVLLMGNGDGTFAPPVESAVNAQVTNVAAADFLGNGLLGIAAAEWVEGKNIDVLVGTCH